MLVIPAVDIQDGRVVRLLQGDAARRIDYSDDPVTWAGRWAEAGAPWLHVVDLDGAFAGRPVHLDLLGRICRLAIRVQVGGGIRMLGDVAAALKAGASRVIVGTAARDLAGKLVRLGEQLCVAIDARDGLVAVRAWRGQTAVAAIDLARRLRDQGVRRFIYTDIARDGTLSGPNVKVLRAFVEAVGVPVVAAGGIASDHDLDAVAETGVEGVIIGRALYEGRMDLERLRERWSVPAC